MKTFDKNESFLNMLANFFDEPKKFKQLIDSNNNLSISGSSALMLVNNQEYDNADIDVYIDISGVPSLMEPLLEQIHDFIVSEGYIMKNRSQNEAIHTVSLQPNEYDLFTYNPYWSLREYIHKVVSYKNICSSTSIDFIFIKTPVHKMIIESFDMDIVKNYYCKGTVYSYFPKSIQERKAIITKKHFIERICKGNERDRFKFIERYNKYKRRGYTIFIDSIRADKLFIGYFYRNVYDPNIHMLIYKYIIGKAISNYIKRKRIYRYIYVLQNSIILKNNALASIVTKLKDCKIELTKKPITKKRKFFSYDDIAIYTA